MSHTPEDRPDPLRRLFLALVGVVAALLIGVVALLLLDPGQGGIATSGRTANVVTGSELGGVMELTGTDGQAVSTAAFDDRYQLVYFGFTFCPDICPNALYDVSVALEELGAQAQHLQPIFVTVDPKRDTPEILRQYMQAFHDSFIALTGSEEAIARAARTFGAGYSFPQGQDDPYYTVNHTALIYVLGPGHKLITTFNHQTPATAMVDTLRQILPAAATGAN